jgi:hypothetical protein
MRPVRPTAARTQHGLFELQRSGKKASNECDASRRCATGLQSLDLPHPEWQTTSYLKDLQRFLVFGLKDQACAGRIT